MGKIKQKARVQNVLFRGRQTVFVKNINKKINILDKNQNDTF